MGDESFKKPPWEKSPRVAKVALTTEDDQDLSMQDTLRARNNDDSHARQPSTVEDIFPGLKLPEGTIDGAAPATTTPTHHRRTTSALKSAAEGQGLPTTPGALKPVTQNRHNRQVSWGLENNTKLEISSSADNSRLLQPVLNTEQNVVTLPDGTNLSISSLPYFHPARGGSGRISLEDLKTTRPVEAEAEKYLMNALEKRDPLALDSNYPDAGVSAGVLGSIPNETLEALRPEIDSNSIGSHSHQSSNHRDNHRNDTGEESESTSRRSSLQLLHKQKFTRAPLNSPPVRHRRTATVSVFHVQ